MKTMIFTMLFMISTNVTAESIDEKRHRTAPYARGLSFANKAPISREQYTLIANSMAGNFKNDLDDEGRKFFLQKVAKDQGCKITKARSGQGNTYLVTCP